MRKGLIILLVGLAVFAKNEMADAATVDCGTSGSGCVVCATAWTGTLSTYGTVDGTTLRITSSTPAKDVTISVPVGEYVYGSCIGCEDHTGSEQCHPACIFGNVGECTAANCRIKIQTSQTCAANQGQVFQSTYTCAIKLCNVGAPGSDSKGTYKYICTK